MPRHGRLDVATKGVRYKKRQDVFQTTVKVPKGTPLGAHDVVAELRDAAGVVEADAATPIEVVPRSRPRR